MAEKIELERAKFADELQLAKREVGVIGRIRIKTGLVLCAAGYRVLPDRIRDMIRGIDG